MSHAAVLDAKVLDLGLYYPQAPAGRSPARLVVMLGLAAVLVVALAAFARPWLTAGDGAAPAIRVPLAQQQFVASLNVDDKAELLVEGGDAAARNAAIPLLGLPMEHVRQFQLAGGSYPTALRCLTQAIYYEAAVEPVQGRRAVAQVILNRMRHPAYPHSVCGVVYQGSERRTGCQFSFTCDGSLLRAPAAAPWRQAEEIAREALAGKTEPSVGTATHYHADYVLPKWAFQLGKIQQIGRHIFYRFQGGWGQASTLSQAYSGSEFIPALNLAALRERLADGTMMPGEPAETFTPGLTVAPAAYDRHAASDVGGRIDMTKEWRLAIPDPVSASSRYRAALGETGAGQADTRAAVAAAPAGAAPKEAAATPAPSAPTAAAPAPGHGVALK